MRGALFALAALSYSVIASAQPPPGFNGVYVRVVDNGAGLCTIAVTSDGHAMAVSLVSRLMELPNDELQQTARWHGVRAAAERPVFGGPREAGRANGGRGC